MPAAGEFDEAAGRRGRGRRHRAREDPVGADVRRAPRRVREVLRPRPRDRTAGRARPGGRRHRRAVDRRARHAADDADVPHRRHGVARLRAVHARDAAQGHGPVRRAARPSKGREQKDADGGGKSLIVMNRSGSINIVDDKGVVRERYSVVYGARLKVRDGQQVEKGQVLVEWDPYTFSILTEGGRHGPLQGHHRQGDGPRGRGRYPNHSLRQSSRSSAPSTIGATRRRVSRTAPTH